MPQPRTAFAACLVLATVPACSANWPFPPDTWLGMPCAWYRDRPRDVHVEVRFVDARQVALLANDGATSIAAGGAPSESPFTAGDHATGQFSSGKYAARAAREADGGLVLLWSSDMPLPSGARQILVTPGGVIQDLPVKAEALGLPAARGIDPFVLTLCIDTREARHGGLVPFSHPPKADQPCEARLRLSTPWSNVASVREITAATPDYGAVIAPGVRSQREACDLPAPLPASEVVLFEQARRP